MSVRGADFFGRKIVKVSSDDIAQLESEGKIKTYTAEQARDIVKAEPKKKIRIQANDIYQNMPRNNEILIHGQIPAERIKTC